MDDMSTFERDIAAVVQRAVGPVRPVDAMAIARAAATRSTRWRFQSMFSATKFVLAGAIVALFGGFLLSGVITRQPSDEPLPPAAASASSSPDADARVESVRSDLLPGVDLVTEEVEPGVYRVLADGNEDHAYDGFDRVVAGADGSLWARRAKGGASDRIWAVGGPATLPTAPRGNINPDAYLMAVHPDGRLVEAHHGGLSIGRNTEDASSVFELSGFAPTALSVLDDTVWASWMSERDTVRLGTFDDQGWTEYATPDGIESVRDLGYAASVDGVASTPDGDVWIAIADNWGAGFGGGALVRFDGATWTEVQPFGDDLLRRISDAHYLTVAPGGALWVLVWLLADDEADAMELPADRTGSAQALLRFDGQSWDAYLSHDVLPDVDPSELGLLRGPIVVDEAGRVWASVERLTLGDPTQRTLGDHLIAFDGVSTVYFEEIRDVEDLAIADGAVWAAAADGLYVITPEVVAATRDATGYVLETSDNEGKGGGNVDCTNEWETEGRFPQLGPGKRRTVARTAANCEIQGQPAVIWFQANVDGDAKDRRPGNNEDDDRTTLN